MFVLCLMFTLVSSLQHSYPNRDKGEPFPKWSKLCDNGSVQSPINIERNKIFYDINSTVHLWNYDQHLYDISFHSAGYTVSLYDFPENMRMECQLLDGVFYIEEIHMHWMSEHTIDGRRYDLEVQIVHKNERYPYMFAALKEPNGVAIISLLYHVGQVYNEFFEILIDALQYLREQNIDLSGIRAKRDKPLILSSLLTGREAILYRGSLNRPPCFETVNWLVILQTEPAPKRLIEELKLFQDDEGKPLKYNYRDTQLRNCRILTAVRLIDANLRKLSGATEKRISHYVLGNVLLLAVSYALS